mgnify:CR=1 FL=1
MIKVGIIGYGNLGKGAEKAVCAAKDMALAGVFTRRDPAGVKTVSGAKVYSADDLKDFVGKIDVMILCGGSATDLPKQTAEYVKMFNTVDSFDTHAKIPEHFAAVDKAAKESGKIGRNRGKKGDLHKIRACKSRRPFFVTFSDPDQRLSFCIFRYRYF